MEWFSYPSPSLFIRNIYTLYTILNRERFLRIQSQKKHMKIVPNKIKNI